MHQALIALSVAAATAAEPAPVTFDALTVTRPAVRLAPRLLPADVAARVVEGEVSRLWLPAHRYRVVFRERPAPLEAELCTRRAHGLDLEFAGPQAPAADAPATVIARSEGDLFAVAFPGAADTRSCDAAEGWVGVAAGREAETLVALHRLREAMLAARSAAPLPFELTCVSSEAPDACGDPRRALATLPLQALFGVQFETGAYKVLSEENGVRVRQTIPSPDGRPATATAAFGRSGADGRSWRVVLRAGPDGRLQGVDLTRSTVVYH